MSSSSSIAGLFGKSPIRPLQEHMQSVVECAQNLMPFFDAVIKNEWKLADEYYEKIVKTENRADTEKKQIRLHLPKSLFMPIPRQDLLNLLTKQDKLANICKDIAGLISGRKMILPEGMPELLMPYVTTAIDSALAAKNVIDELDELIETGFGGREIELVEKLISRLDELEHITDKQQISIRAQLHSLENQLPPINVVFLYKIIEWIGNLADCAQSIGDQIQIIVAR